MKVVLSWCAAIAVAAALLVLTGFQSRDPDSALYARLSADLAQQPVSRWIAPEWGGAWNQHGLFREHPAGILLPSAALIRAGFPGAQAAYAVNLIYQVAVILLIPLVAAIVVRGAEARSLAWILQLLPVSFAYRIRANQEHPLLMCFLALIYATHRARERAGWIALMVIAFCVLVLIKGAFAMFALVGAALWLLIVPAPAGGSNARGWAGLVAAVLAAAVMMIGYEAVYVRTTGESFVEFYRSTRLGESMRLSDPGVITHAIVNVGWYVGRLAWFAAPWSIAAAAVVAIWLRTAGAPAIDASARRAIFWSVAVTAVFILVLSPANVRAERFIFPTYFIIASVGVVASIRRVDSLRGYVERADRLVWLPVAVWLMGFMLSLASRVLR